MNGFAGTATLTGLALRRDRFMLPAWALTFVAVTGFSAAASKDLYPSAAEVARVSEGWNSTAALVAMHGRIYDPTSLGAASLVKMTGIGTALVALLAVLLVVRHTRADEEVGRTELAAGGVVGTYAALVAAVLVSGGTVVALSLLSGLSLVAAGLPVPGSLAFTASWCGAGLFFAAVGAVAAQLATSARAARGIGSLTLATCYVVRAVGDTTAADGPRWISWLSPVGWAQQVRPFAGDRWWALTPAILGTAVVLAVAAALLRHRDLGAGLIAERPGEDRGPRLVSAWALVWRLERPALLVWGVACVLFGLLLGSIASTVGDLLDSERFRSYIELLGGVTVLEDAFLSTELGFAGIIVAGFGISAALRLRADEAQGRAEPLLATGVSRPRLAAAHLGVALAGTVVLVALVGLGVGTAHAVAVGDPGQVGRVLVAALVRLPAVWVMTAGALALFGLSGRLAPLAWVFLVGFIVVGEFGPLMDLPHWTLEMSPFSHVPALPGGAWSMLSTAVLTLVAVALALLGVGAFSRRDLQPD